MPCNTQCAVLVKCSGRYTAANRNWRRATLGLSRKHAVAVHAVFSNSLLLPRIEFVPAPSYPLVLASGGLDVSVSKPKSAYLSPLSTCS